MKPLVSVREMRKSWPGLLLLDKVYCDIYEGDKIGLIGSNGTGKTTLLKILLGQERIEYGDIVAKPELRAGWLTQYQTVDSGETVAGALSESDYSSSLTAQIRAIEEKMADPAFYESSDYKAEMDRYNALQEEHAKFSGAGVSDRARKVLDSLGGRNIPGTARIRDLSGGEMRKVALAKVLVAAESMDLLLLDEPMNHLDIDAIEWLEGFICDYAGTVIVVSHDRYMLDDTVFRIFEIEGARLRVYEGNFSDYSEQKVMREAVIARSRARSEKEERRQRDIIEKLRGRNRFDAQITNRLIRLSKMEKPQDEILRKRRLKIKFQFAQERPGKAVLSARGLSKSFGSKTLFEEGEFDIETGWKVGLIGPNGCGKTTLLKMIVGLEQQTAGELHASHVAKIGYFEQGHLSLEPQNTLVDEIRSMDAAMLEDEAKGLLGRYHFKGDMVYSKVSQLSGGERGRLAILKLVLSPCNILVLDEPTNHLDLLSREAVELAMNTFEGTIITASHDRYFLDTTCDHIIAMYGGHIRNYPGNYTQYRSMLSREDEVELGQGPAYYIVRKGYTDWDAGKRYRQGERFKLEPEELKRHRWALETRHLVREGDQ